VTVWRAFLIVVLPGYGLWLLARDAGSRPDASYRKPPGPFSRRPDWFDLFCVTLAGVLLAGAWLADSRFLELAGVLFGIAAAYRLALRFLLPRAWFRSDIEFRAAANARTLTRVALYGLLIWLVVTQGWTSAEFLGAAVVLLVMVETLMVLAMFAIAARILRRKHLAKP
jgi:hypothetical protein